MPGSLGDERVGAGHVGPQLHLDVVQQAQHGRLDPWIGQVHAECADLTRARPAPTTTGADGT
ncbi:hypothetical protein TPA0907_50100 [Micromonospora humidisoli]|nr:hypothetical protein TPA0907_50100 [Micromonospora sp. AKA109]